ncbi:MAG: hypothetical protein ACRCU5_06425 [Rhizobiaceae bacterium]
MKTLFCFENAPRWFLQRPARLTAPKSANAQRPFRNCTPTARIILTQDAGRPQCLYMLLAQGVQWGSFKLGVRSVYKHAAILGGIVFLAGIYLAVTGFSELATFKAEQPATFERLIISEDYYERHGNFEEIAGAWKAEMDATLLFPIWVKIDQGLAFIAICLASAIYFPFVILTSKNGDLPVYTRFGIYSLVTVSLIAATFGEMFNLILDETWRGVTPWWGTPTFVVVLCLFGSLFYKLPIALLISFIVSYVGPPPGRYFEPRYDASPQYQLLGLLAAVPFLLMTGLCLFSNFVSAITFPLWLHLAYMLWQYALNREMRRV